MRFMPYEGTKPYLFISYARGDTQIMLEAMNLLREKTYRLWYDEGIPGGNDWPTYIAEHLSAAQAVVFFLSGNSMVSPNCYSEMVAARKQGKKVICILLDESAQKIGEVLSQNRVLSAEEESAIEKNNEDRARKRSSAAKIPKPHEWVDALQGVPCYEAQEAAVIEEKILRSGLLTESFQGAYHDTTNSGGKINLWLIAIAACFVLMLGLGYGSLQLYRSMRPQEETVEEIPVEAPKKTIDTSDIPGIAEKVDFGTDKQLERALRSEISMPEGDVSLSDLQRVAALRFCGRTVVKSAEGIAFTDGKWTVNSVQVGQGEIESLSLLQKIYSLEELTLVYQKIENINRLKELPLLIKLDIAGNPIAQLDLDGGFQSLQEINIAHTNIQSLQEIHAPSSLKRIYVSEDMLPLALDGSAAYEVVLIK